SDRERIRREVLDDPLVEALEAGGEQRQRRQHGELLHERLRELPSFRRERDDRPGRLRLVDGVERCGDDVHAEDHSRPAAIRLVVDLARAERCRVAVVEEPQLELSTEDVRDRPLLGQPGIGVGNEGEDVDAHGLGYSGSVNPTATTIRPPARSTFRTHASTRGSDAPESSSSTSFAGYSSTSRTRPSSRPLSSSTLSPTSWKT